KTRIHINDQFNNKTIITDVPENARYNDGIYNFRAKTITSNLRNTYSSIQNITLDNFLPFITRFQFKVGASAPSSVVFYEIDRAQDEGDEKTLHDGYVTNDEHYYKINFNGSFNKYFVEINTSEPVQELKLKVKKQNEDFGTTSYPMTALDNTMMKWRRDLTRS